MTVSAATRSVVYLGAQSSPLAIPFRFFSSPTSADLSVYIYQVGSVTNPVELVLNTDYTIVNNGYTGGTLTLLANGGLLPSGWQLTILGTPAETQLVSLQNQTAYNPNAVEGGLDLSTMISQAISDQLTLTIQAMPGDVSRNLTLPTVANSKNALLGTDGNGNLIATLGGVPTINISAAMIPVVQAATLLQAIANMGPWGSALVTSTLGTTARSLAARAGDTVNVLDFGADPTGSASSSAAFNAAYASKANTTAGCALYCPSGTYKIDSNLVFNGTGPFTIYGDGPTSQIAVSIASGDLMTVTNVPFLHIHDIQFVGYVVRNAGTWILTASGQAAIVINNTFANLNLGGIWNIASSSVLQMDSNFSSTSGAISPGNNQVGDTVLRISHVSQATITNNYFISGNNSSSSTNPGFNRAPCVWIGSSFAAASNTSLTLTGNNFVGGGPRSVWNISGITSTSVSFVVTTTAVHDFNAGDFIVLRGSTLPSGYQNVFRVSSATSTTITVTSTLNPGTTTVASTAESYASCLYVANDQGSCNESRLTGNIFEAQDYLSYGSASVYFDGRRGPHVIEGWTLAGNYYDFGATGVLLSGKDNGSGIQSVYGISYAGGLHENSTRCIHLEGVSGISISGLQCDGFGPIQNGQGGSSFGDALSAAGTGSVAIHIFAGWATPYTQGVTITNCNLGMGRNWNLDDMASTGFNSGLVIDGAGVQDVLVGDCQIYGYDVAGAVKYDNSSWSGTNRWKFKNCQINYAGAANAPVTVPTVSSATSIALIPGADVVKVTGTTPITTITNGTAGQVVTLLSVSGMVIGTGGNIMFAITYQVGLQCTLAYDGANWWIR